MLLTWTGAFGQSALDDARAAAQGDLAVALKELEEVRAEISKEKEEMGAKMTALEQRLIRARADYDKAVEGRDARRLELSNAREGIKEQERTVEEVLRMLGETTASFEAGLPDAELPEYRGVLEEAGRVGGNGALPRAERFQAFRAVVEAGLARLADAAGGRRFDGQAAVKGGEVKAGRFLMVGPAGVFVSKDGTVAGVAEWKAGQAEPAINVPGGGGARKAIEELVRTGSGMMLVDPTLGNAQKFAATRPGIRAQIAKGGPLMAAILGLGGLAIAVALVKAAGLARIRRIRPGAVEALVETLRTKGAAAAVAGCAAIGEPAGGMLRAGVENAAEPRELVEEAMFEALLRGRQQLARGLPLVILGAVAAPVAGLLATVTGLMETLRLMAVVGTVDLRRVLLGASEALVMTAYGVAVAIPALLLYWYLRRRCAAVGADLEKVALTFLNRLKAGKAEGGER